MNKIFLLTFLLLVGIVKSFGQVIPDSSFEQWVTISNIEYPQGWQTSENWSQLNVHTHSAIKDSIDHCDGGYSLKLTSWFIPDVSTTFPGIATNGTDSGLTLSSISGGSPDVVRSLNLSGCYQYVPANGHSAVITAILFKRNTGNGARDTVALTSYLITGAASSWTNFQSNFNYQSTKNPDSILIGLSSSPGERAGSSKTGSTLLVDNLRLNGVNGIDELNSIFKNVSVFPSPTTNDLNIHIDYNTYKMTFYNISDATRRVVLSGKMNYSSEKINTVSISNGIYILTLHDQEGEKLYSTRVTVSH